MVESHNENATLANMATELCADFHRFKEELEFENDNYDDFDDYIINCEQTPPDGIDVASLIRFTMRLNGKTPNVRSIPCIVVEENGLKLAFSSKANMDKLQNMADLLIYIQDSEARRTAYEPIYDLLKATVWHVNGLFEEAEELPASFNAELAGEMLQNLDVEVDGAIMGIIYAKYMESATGKTQLQFLADHGLNFSASYIKSFSDWLNSTDDTDFLYTREQIKKALNNHRRVICAKLREKMIGKFSLASQPEAPESQEDPMQAQRIASEEVRAQALQAAFRPQIKPKGTEPITPEEERAARLLAIFTPPPLEDGPEVTVIYPTPTPIRPIPIHQVGKVHDKKQGE